MTAPPAVVIVTGCSSGIGLATATTLAGEGHRVYATMRDPSRSGTLVTACERLGVEVDVRQLDVTDVDSIRHCVDDVLHADGRIDGIVNNAGVGPFAPVEKSTDDEWHSTFDTNLFGPVRLTRAVLPSMRAQGAGTIVNVSSIAGRLAAIPTQGAYAASKHALCALTDALVGECTAFGISTYCIEPGFFATEIMSGERSAPAGDDPYRSISDGVQDFFTASIEAAPPPDLVARTVLNAIEGRLGADVHHPVGFDGQSPTRDAARYPS